VWGKLQRGTLDNLFGRRKIGLSGNRGAEKIHSSSFLVVVQEKQQKIDDLTERGKEGRNAFLKK